MTMTMNILVMLTVHLAILIRSVSMQLCCGAHMYYVYSVCVCTIKLDFNSVVPPDTALQINYLLSAPSVSQIELSCTLDTHMFNLLLEASSTDGYIQIVLHQCALHPGNALYPLGHHAITCKHGGDVVA